MSDRKSVGVSGRDHYDNIYQTELAEEAEWLDRTSKNKVDSIENLLRKNKIACDTILELGCGTGSIIRGCQQRKLAKTYLAVDYSQTAIDYLRAHSDGIETHVADVTDPAFTLGASPDVLVLSHVIEHLEDPSAFLESIRRIGFKYLIAEVPLDDLLIGRLSALSTKDRTQNLAGHVQFFTATSFRRLLVSSGISILDSRRYAQILDMDTIKFLCNKNHSSPLTYYKMALGRYLRLLTGPIWARFFSAHYAVLARLADSPS